MATAYPGYRDRGARFVSTLYQDEGGAPADTSFAAQWGQAFGLTWATAADPEDTMRQYLFNTPANLFVNAVSMEIMAISYEFTEASFRTQLESCLSQ